MTKNIYAKIERIVEDADKCKKQLEIVRDMLNLVGNVGKDPLIIRVDEDGKIVRGMIIDDEDIAVSLLTELYAQLGKKLKNLRKELMEIV